MAGKPVSQSSKNLGARMKKILKDLKISQEIAAFRLGLPYQSSLNHYLSGRSEVPVNIIEKFQQEFKTPLNVLMGADDFDVPRVYDSKALGIMQAMDEYLNDNSLLMQVKDKVKISTLLYKEENSSRDAVCMTLSALRLANPEMFKKQRSGKYKSSVG